MNTENISKWTFRLIVSIAAIAFILSYYALQQVAFIYGIPFILSLAWPLLIDFALVVFSLAAVAGRLRGERTWWPWAMIILFTLATIGFNLIHSDAFLPAKTIFYAVAAVPPLALVLSFESGMSMLRGSLEKREIITEMGQIRADRDNLADDRDNLIEQIRQLERQRNQLKETIEEAEKRADVVISKDIFDPHQRQAAVLVLHRLGYNIPQTAKMLSVSGSTIKNDRGVWNGEL